MSLYPWRSDTERQEVRRGSDTMRPVVMCQRWSCASFRAIARALPEGGRHGLLVLEFGLAVMGREVMENDRGRSFGPAES
ncbi:hypothetical protein ACFVJW_16650 [Streptomyces libani]|uniref:Uncharacterized protein n=2 Tax=Streptomyces nigrescens TaxID=1920 RepID=A0A640TD79_STRNI|nr:hypothetical protein Sliba_09140 [Streptomyces libani subsp. libani]GGV87089.1 hypothetical protein GCM10010500_06580 [Streptomyces libani subsp. libani]